MTLLYRVGDEIVIEASPEIWKHVHELLEIEVAQNDFYERVNQSELIGFTNAIRAHLQHICILEKTPVLSNDDLI